METKTAEERKSALRTKIQQRIKLPFKINYCTKVGGEEKVEQVDELSIFELRGIINIATIILRSKGKVDRNGLEVKIGSVHSGSYIVKISLDEYAGLYNVLKDVEKRLADVEAGNYDDEMEIE